MRAVKSLDGYNFFISGHVQTCFCNILSEDVPVCFIKAKVAPLQRANDKPHEPWVCLNKEKGYVVAAHCTCKAGLGEACSHIGALLFKVEAVGRFNLRNASKTSEACSWNRSFRKKVTAQRVVDIDFTKPKYGKKPKRKVNQRKPVAVEGTSFEDQKRALEELRRICPTAGCLFKGESDTDTASEDEDLPPLLSCYRDHDPNECTEEELGRRCADFVKDFTVTEIQCENLEKMTRSQSQSMLWQRHREGRITATIAHDVKTLQLKTSGIEQNFESETDKSFEG